jgi:hypothetical protein|tara:strand:- start:1301 stop:1621 length:321 start_codon:yes stop_codon:yes gene_type:complete
MPKNRSTSRARELKIGDLVYHLLYGKTWVGVLLDIIDVHQDKEGSVLHKQVGLVKMQPGSKYEFFFKDMVSRKNRINDSLGMVSTNWLFKLEGKVKNNGGIQTKKR